MTQAWRVQGVRVGRCLVAGGVVREVGTRRPRRQGNSGRPSSCPGGSASNDTPISRTPSARALDELRGPAEPKEPRSPPMLTPGPAQARGASGPGWTVRGRLRKFASAPAG